MVIALDKHGEEIFGQKGGGAASLDMPDGCFFSPSDIMRLTPIQSEKIGLCPEKPDSVRKNRTQSGKVGLSPEKQDCGSPLHGKKEQNSAFRDSLRSNQRRASRVAGRRASHCCVMSDPPFCSRCWGRTEHLGDVKARNPEAGALFGQFAGLTGENALVLSIDELRNKNGMWATPAIPLAQLYRLVYYTALQ